MDTDELQEFRARARILTEGPSHPAGNHRHAPLVHAASGHTLVNGVDVQGKKVKFLRRIPTDPMTGKAEWGLHSMQDDPDADSYGGQSVFDVYSKSQGTALDGTKYSTW